MSYIGQRPVVGRYIKLDQISSGFNGSNTGFSMTAGSQAVFPGTARNLLLSLGGVIQEPDTDFTISGSTLTFTTPPVANTTFFGVIYGDMQATGTPSDGTVLPASIASSGNFSFPEVTVTGDVNIADSIIHSGDSDTKIRFPAADTVSVETGGNEAIRVDSSGKLFVGTSTSRSPGGVSTTLQVEGTNAASSSLSLTRNQNNNNCAIFSFAKTRGNSTGTTTIVQDDDRLGDIMFAGADGTDIASIAAKIQAFVDGTPGSNDMPGRLVFSTTADGAASPTERMRIDSSGRVGIGTSSFSDTASALTIKNMHSGSEHTLLEIICDDNESARVEFSETSTSRSGSIRYIFTSDQRAMTFHTDGSGASSERMRINSSGNVGIGTTNPAALLSLNQSIPELRLQSSNNNLGMGDFIGLISLHTSDGSSPGAGEVFRIKTESSSSIGADYTTRLYNRNGSGGGATEVSLGNGQGSVYFATNTTGNATPSVRMAVMADGDVGIGTTNPSTKLHVNGDITAADSIVSANLSGRNMIINGDMRIVQRGTSGSYDSSSTKILACDRWNIVSNGTTGTAAQVAEAPDGSGFKYSIKITNTNPVGSIAAGNTLRFGYKIERQDIQRLAYGTSSAKSSVISFWVRGSITGKIGVACTRDGRVFSAGVDITANTWKFVEVVIPADTSTGFSGNDYDTGININISCGAGSNSTSGPTNGSWLNFHVAYTSGFTAGQQGAYLTTDNSTFQITGVQFEIGSKATPFEHKNLSEELLKCQRYFFNVKGDNNHRTGIPGYANSTTELRAMVQFPTPMRATPTFTGSATAMVFDAADDSASFNCNTLSQAGTLTNPSPHMMMIETSTSSMTAGQAGTLEFRADNGFLEFSAEL